MLSEVRINYVSGPANQVAGRADDHASSPPELGSTADRKPVVSHVVLSHRIKSLQSAFYGLVLVFTFGAQHDGGLYGSLDVEPGLVSGRDAEEIAAAVRDGIAGKA
jgi:hypothetical protein